MQHYAAFDQGLHCLQKKMIYDFPEYKGLTLVTTHLIIFKDENTFLYYIHWGLIHDSINIIVQLYFTGWILFIT